MKGNDHMKNIKKIFSMLTITVMIFAFNCMTAFAAEGPYTITLTNESSNVSISGKTYTAYMVFNLSYNTDKTAYTYLPGDDCLSQDYSAVCTAMGVADVNALITKMSSASAAEARKFADSIYDNYIKSGVVNSAYKESVTASSETATITVDKAGYYLVYGEGSSNEKAVTSLVMLGSTDPKAEITVKLDAPTITKEIYHNEANSWGSVGDNQIGDKVNFRTISNVPNYVSSYSNYKYIIHDTMTSGLTVDINSVHVYIDANKTTELDKSSYITVNKTDDQNFTVTIDVLQAIKDGKLSEGATLYTYYDATLNESALRANAAPDETNHNDNEAWLEYSNNPYDNDSSAETPKSKVFDWTFTVNVSKTNSDGTKQLSGAVFNIKLGDNVLKFKETGTKEYTLSTDGTGSEDMITGDDGIIKVIGLDDSVDYMLVEKTAPDGYNRAPDTTFNLTSSYNVTNSAKLETLAAGVTNGDQSSASGNTITVKNNSGSALVGTGGIGTTIFYVGGGIIMVVAAVLLITKKRMKNK